MLDSASLVKRCGNAAMDNKQQNTSRARPAGRQAAGDSVDAGIRRQQDLAAEVLQLKEALREARLLAEESQLRCVALEEAHREALAEIEDASARALGYQAEMETLRLQFESRITELREMLDGLHRRDDLSRRSSGMA